MKASAEVVRFSFRFVGQDLWVGADGDTRADSSDARLANRIISRILTLDADLQYRLEDGKYWMPYRQILSGRVRVPFMGGLVIPFQSETRFEDYSVNSGRAHRVHGAAPRHHDQPRQRDGAVPEPQRLDPGRAAAPNPRW